MRQLGGGLQPADREEGREAATLGRQSRRFGWGRRSLYNGADSSSSLPFTYSFGNSINSSSIPNRALSTASLSCFTSKPCP